jgi:hexosaminidase
MGDIERPTTRRRAVGRKWRAAGLLASAIVVSALSESAFAHPAPVIPLPATIVTGPGAFAVDPATTLVASRQDPEAAAGASFLAGLFAKSRGTALPVVSGAPRDGAIVFERRTGLGPEDYTLEVTPTRITIAATAAAGFFYGGVTLWQLVPAGNGRSEVAAVRIADRPAFAWRGLMLDSARHFERPEFVKRFIDGMALHKLNVLHWHLTDDQGWRLEIRRYPRLTSVGGYRVPAGRAALADLDPATGRPRVYGGYYTQAEVRDIVGYAAARHVTVVPEIEMPGHASAAIAAYPELGMTPIATVPADWGIYDHVFNVSEATCQFLENVLAEVSELFPGPYVHVGGDEVLTREWSESREAADRAHALGLAGVGELPHYLVQRMARFLATRGRRLVGWDEIIAPGLGKDAVVLSWRGAEGALAAARRGNDTVLAPWPTLYFDFRQSAAADEPPGRVKTVTLADVYAFDPRLPGLSPAEATHVLGLQANIWTEHIRTEERVGHATFPRAAALAEVGWTPAAQRDYPGFIERLATLLPRYRLLGVPFADSAFAVRFGIGEQQHANAVSADLRTESGAGEIRYSLDGTMPDARSPRYTQPLTLKSPAELTAASFEGEAMLAAPRRYSLAPDGRKRRTSQDLRLCTEALPLALEIDAGASETRPVVQLDLMNPCWIWPGIDLTAGHSLLAAVGPVPFNYQIGADAGKIRVGDARSSAGELEIYADRCDGEPIATLPLAGARAAGVTALTRTPLPARPGVHDLCMRFARPTLDPIWAIDWVEIGEGSTP